MIGTSLLQAMHLVYRAMEKEPVPASLPTSLIPPSKRKKFAGALPGAVAVLPAMSGLMASPAPLKESLRSTPPLNNTPLLSTSPVNLSPKHSFKSSSPVCWCNTGSLYCSTFQYRSYIKITLIIVK